MGIASGAIGWPVVSRTNGSFKDGGASAHVGSKLGAWGQRCSVCLGACIPATKKKERKKSTNLPSPVSPSLKAEKTSAGAVLYRHLVSEGYRRINGYEIF